LLEAVRPAITGWGVKSKCWVDRITKVTRIGNESLAKGFKVEGLPEEELVIVRIKKSIIAS